MRFARQKSGNGTLRRSRPLWRDVVRGSTGALALACALILTGCSKKAEPDVFYRLSADGAIPSGEIRGPDIGIESVDIPDYIDRSELVFQSAPNRFEIPANHRWTGSIQKNILSVLTKNLAARLHPKGVVAQPFARGAEPPTRVAVRIERFHALTGEDAILEATWFISGTYMREVEPKVEPEPDPEEEEGDGDVDPPADEAPAEEDPAEPEFVEEPYLITKSATFRQDLDEGGYEGVVAAKSALLGKLADAIAKDL